MSNSASPTHFTGDSDHYYDANFTAEISQKMRVPKRIKVDGESNEAVPILNGPSFNPWVPEEKFEMHVPEKIVVLDEQINSLYYGYDKHLGTKAMPRELELEHSMSPPDPDMIRVQTPPRVITLDQHFYPTADEYQPQPYAVDNIRNQRICQEPALHVDTSGLNMTLSETGQMGEGMTMSEEVVHLRRQLAKLNRRVMSIELDNMQRQQREKLLYAIGLAYLFIKTIVWLSRSS